MNASINRGDEAPADEDADARQQPPGDDGADDANDDVADQPEAAAPDHLPASQPAIAPTISQMMMLCASIASPVAASTKRLQAKAFALALSAGWEHFGTSYPSK